jgi:sugar/nucleoside kinase (ribokinase family)
MCTYLGLANNIADEVDKKIIKDADILYLEGYLWDTPETIASMREAIEIAREGYDVEGYADEVKDDEEDPNHTKVAFTLSDAFCVDRHKIDFMDLLSHIDILFANYMEMQIFIGEDFAENNYKKVVETIKNHNPNLIIAMTHSEYGAIVFEGIKKIHNSPTTKIKKITDATGAGDAFAAGFLSGFSRNLPLDKCANLGNLLAGNVIQKLGARLEKEDVAKLTINN